MKRASALWHLQSKHYRNYRASAYSSINFVLSKGLAKQFLFIEKYVFFEQRKRTAEEATHYT